MSEETHLLMQLMGKVEALTMKVEELTRTVEHGQNKKKWYSMAEFCQIMKLSRQTIQERLAAGQYEWAQKDGKGWRFPAEKVEKITANLAR